MGRAPSRSLFQRTACPTTARSPPSCPFSPRPSPASSSTSPEPAPGASAIVCDDSVRPARPGDIGLLVRKMTPDFIGPFEAALAAHGIDYRLVGGKEYYAREEVQALTTVLRAIDNPADRLSVFAALRSPFFGLSDDDVYQFVASGGILNPLAPIRDGVRNARSRRPCLRHPPVPSPPPPHGAARAKSSPRSSSARAPCLLPPPAGGRPGRRQPLEDPRSRSRLRGGGPRHPARGGAVPRGRGPGGARGRRLAGGRASGRRRSRCSPSTRPRASSTRSSSSPISSPAACRRETSSCATPPARAGSRSEPSSPTGWDQALGEEKRQQEAEERRLLYVALTRARDHLVIPCFPDQQRPGWLERSHRRVRRRRPRATLWSAGDNCAPRRLVGRRRSHLVRHARAGARPARDAARPPRQGHRRIRRRRAQGTDRRRGLGGRPQGASSRGAGGGAARGRGDGSRSRRR